MVKKNGRVRGHIKFKCNLCLHQWRGFYGRQINYERHYHSWIFGRRTLLEIADAIGISPRTLQKKFDAIDVEEGLVGLPGKEAINLQIDATYFGSEYGFICFHDGRRVIYFHEIKAESSGDVILGLRALKKSGYRFKSVTIDGRKGFDEAIRKELGGVPIQLCLFHTRAIVRRYLGPNPTAEAALDLSLLTAKLKSSDPQNFINQFHRLTIKHRIALLPAFIKANRKRQRVRLAYRFLEQNMHRIFTFKDIPTANIPPTTNHLEGLFSHLKERLKLHRGLCQSRKKTAIKFLLKHI